MYSIYSDIINALENKKYLEIKKIKENEDFEKIIKLVKQLLKILYIEKIVTLNDSKIKNLLLLYKIKKDIIKKIKQEILNISEKHHVKINGLIKNNEIQKEELDFELKLIYHDKETYNEIEKIKKYRTEHNEIEDINSLIIGINEIKIILTNKLNEIINIYKQNKEPSKLRLIKHIKWKNKNIKQIKSKQEEIKKTIHEYNLKKKDINLKIYCFEELTNIQDIYNELKEINLEELTEKKCAYIIQQLNIGYKKSLKHIKNILEEKKEKLIKLRKSSKLHQDKINDIFYHNNSFSWQITNNMAQQKNIKDTLLIKLILIIELIYEIEKNNFDIFELLEEKKLKKVL